MNKKFLLFNVLKVFEVVVCYFNFIKVVEDFFVI